LKDNYLAFRNSHKLKTLMFKFSNTSKEVEIVNRTLLLLGFALLTLAAPLMLVAGPRDPDNGVAVVFPPWIDEATAMSRVGAAGGAVIRAGNLGFISVAIPDSPEFTQNIRAAGAWLLLDPQVVGMCSTTDNS
jgi:hypothetical protein